ncbi:MAG: hypothetical protein WDN06_09605 [Asticcacaulis sp.]
MALVKLGNNNDAIAHFQNLAAAGTSPITQGRAPERIQGGVPSSSSASTLAFLRIPISISLAMSPVLKAMC